MSPKTKLVICMMTFILAAIMAVGAFGSGQGSTSQTPTTVSDEQIQAGLRVLQENGNPTPLLAATTVKGSKSNSDNRTINTACADAQGPTVPSSNIAQGGQAGGPIAMSANLNLSKSNINRSANLNLSKSNINREAPIGAQAELAVGTITLPSAMAFKKAAEKKDEEKRIAAGQYCVGLLTIDDYEDQVLALFNSETNEAADEVLSVEAQAVIDAINDEFTDSQGIPCLLGDEYASAILLNLVASELVPFEETTTAAVDLSIEKGLDGELRPQQIASYLLTVGNNGSVATNGTVTVTDNLPSSLSLVSTSGEGWSCSGFLQSVNCTNSNPIAPGESSTIQLSVRVNASPGTQITNCAQVIIDGDANTENNRSCISSSVQGDSDT